MRCICLIPIYKFLVFRFIVSRKSHQCTLVSSFCLTTPLPLSVWTLSWKTKNCKNHGKIKALWKRQAYCSLFLVFSFIFQSLTQEDDDKLTFKWHLLACRDHTEKDFHLQLSPLPPLSTSVRIIASPFLPRVRKSFIDAPKSKSLLDHLLHSRFSVTHFTSDLRSYARFTVTCGANYFWQGLLPIYWTSFLSCCSPSLTHHLRSLRAMQKLRNAWWVSGYGHSCCELLRQSRGMWGSSRKQVSYKILLWDWIFDCKKLKSLPEFLWFDIEKQRLSRHAMGTVRFL